MHDPPLDNANAQVQSDVDAELAEIPEEILNAIFGNEERIDTHFDEGLFENVPTDNPIGENFMGEPMETDITH